MPVFLMISLYITSFTPLWIFIFAIYLMGFIDGTIDKMWFIIYLIVIVIVFIASIGIILYSFKRKEATLKYTVSDYTKDNAITTEFLLSNILPLLGFDFTQVKQLILFGLFFVILGILCVRHRVVNTNIVLDILGYNVYTCELENEDMVSSKVKVISRKLYNGDDVYLFYFNDDIALNVSRNS